MRVTTDAFPGTGIWKALTAINPEVETVTPPERAHAGHAMNPSGLLRPGTYVDVAAKIRRSPEQVLDDSATARCWVRTLRRFGCSWSKTKKDEKTGAVGKVLNQQFVRLSGKTRGDFVVVDWVERLANPSSPPGSSSCATACGRGRQQAGSRLSVGCKPHRLLMLRASVASLIPVPPPRAGRDQLLVIIIAGVQAIIFTLNVRQYPRSDNASVTVTTASRRRQWRIWCGTITTPRESRSSPPPTASTDYLASQSTPGLIDPSAPAFPGSQPTTDQGAGPSSGPKSIRCGDLPPEAEVLPVPNIESPLTVSLFPLHLELQRRHPCHRNQAPSGAGGTRPSARRCAAPSPKARTPAKWFH